jgi:chorismate dehydratase
LLIGDRAIHSPSPARHGHSSDETGTEAWAEVWDLGDQWCRWSGYPMVFAMWTARVDAELHGLDAALGEARDLGVAHVAQIAAAEAAPLGLTEPQCVGYLRDNLHFYLGPKERKGLRSFYEHCTALDLAPADCKLLGVAPAERESRDADRAAVPQRATRIRSLEARSNRR